MPDVTATANAIDADMCERVFHAALREGDATGVEAALCIMAVEDPRRAERLFNSLRVAVDLTNQIRQAADAH